MTKNKVRVIVDDMNDDTITIHRQNRANSPQYHMTRSSVTRWVCVLMEMARRGAISSKPSTTDTRVWVYTVDYLSMLPV
jgi:hypothetical protein